MEEVIINGKRYAPVSEASPDAKAITKGILHQWWGDASDEELEKYKNEVVVIVTDTIPRGYEESGMHIDEVLAHIQQYR